MLLHQHRGTLARHSSIAAANVEIQRRGGATNSSIVTVHPSNTAAAAPEASPAVTSPGAATASSPHQNLAAAGAVATAAAADLRLEELRNELLSENILKDAVEQLEHNKVAGMQSGSPQTFLLSRAMAGWYCAGMIVVLSAFAMSAMYLYLKRDVDRQESQKVTESMEPRPAPEQSISCSHVKEAENTQNKQAQMDAQDAAEEAQERQQQAKFDNFDAGCLSQECLPIPESFKCPITKEIMSDPASTVDGLTYERESILAWFRLGNRTSPLTNVALPSLQLTKNIALKSAISEFRRLRPELQRRELQRRDFEAAVMDREKELEDLAEKCSQVLEQKEAQIQEQNFRVAMLQIEASSLSRHLAAKHLVSDGEEGVEAEPICA